MRRLIVIAAALAALALPAKAEIPMRVYDLTALRKPTLIVLPAGAVFCESEGEAETIDYVVAASEQQKAIKSLLALGLCHRVEIPTQVIALPPSGHGVISHGIRMPGTGERYWLVNEGRGG
jgi:hypothetical protein